MKFGNSEAITNLLFVRRMLFPNTKIYGKPWKWLEILSGLGPGEAEGTSWVRVKSFNPRRTTCGETFLERKVSSKELFVIRESYHKRRSAGTGPTVRDESVGSNLD